jgi:chromosome segregation ATPase
MSEGNEAASGGVPNKNMYSQLEAMMNAVKREAAGLEALKSKLKDMEDLKRRNGDLKDKLQASEIANSDLHLMLENGERNAQSQREDMQHLNDIYNEERERHVEVQQNFLTQEQELVHLKGEVAYAQREAAKVQELRKSNQTALGQLASAEKRLEDERLDWMRATKAFEEKITDSQRVKDEVSGHVWKLTDEVKNLRAQLERGGQTESSMHEVLAATRREVVQTNERALMGAEDRLALSIRARKSEQVISHSFRELQREVMRLQQELVTKEESIQISDGQVKSFEEARALEKTQVRAKMNDLLDALATARQANVSLEASAAEARRGGDQSHKELADAENQIESLTQALATVNGELHSREEDLKRAIATTDEYRNKAQSSSNHFEAMQNQVRDGQAKYWGELQAMKEAEIGYVADIEALTVDLEEKRSATRILETEKSEMEQMIMHEQSLATEAQQALRTEVERQKGELHEARTERDDAKEKVHNLSQQLADVEKTIKKNEAMYQKALDNDRSKIQVEIRQKLGRMKNMEQEKQELLKEVEELMMQISENSKEISRLKVELEASKREVHDLEMQYTATLTDKEELVQEVKMASRKEQELRETATRLDSQFRENISRLEVMVKESKKTAASQVAEISNRVKAAVDEADECRRERDKLVESERYANQEVEKFKTEIDLLKRSHDDMQLQMARESANMKRELGDNRGKMKLMQESKSKTDTETMRVRLDQTRLENETARLKEIIKDHEVKSAAGASDLVDLRAELAKINELYRTSKARVIDFEQKDLRRDKKVENAMEEMARMENQHKMEQRRLRVTQQNLEGELAETRSLMTRVQKEAADAKTNLTKLQTSSNTTINGLLEELKKTEETLSNERRKGQTQIMDYHARVGELQSTLEITKGSMEEDLAKTKSAVSDKEHRLIQLEGDNTRFRQAMNDKDDRVQELERARQQDRSKMMELQNTVATQETSLDSTRTELELEQGLRQRLEMKVKELQDFNEESSYRVKVDDGTPTSAFMSDNTDPHRLTVARMVDKSPLTSARDDADDDVEVETEGRNVSMNALSGNLSARSGNLSARSRNGSERPNLGTEYSSSGAVYGYDPEIPVPSQRNVNMNAKKDYDDDILAGVASPPRREGSMHTDFMAMPSRDNYSYGDTSVADEVRADMERDTSRDRAERDGGAESTSAVVNRVTAALSARLNGGNGGGSGSRPGSEGRVGLVCELRDSTTVATALMDEPYESTSSSQEVIMSTGGEEGGDVEASIQRTQDFLRMRLAARGAGGVPSAPARSDGGSASPTHGRTRADHATFSPEVKGATHMYQDSHHDDFESIGRGASGHLGPVRDEPDVQNRLPRKMQNITLAGSRDMDGMGMGGMSAPKGSMDKDAILFGAPHLSPPQPGRAGVGIASVAATVDNVPSPERRLKSHTKAGAGKSKLKKLSISMGDADATSGGEKSLPRIPSGSNVLKRN